MRTTFNKSKASQIYSTGPSSPAWATNLYPCSADTLNTFTNLLGGLPISEESKPTPSIKCLNGREASNVLNAASSLKCRK